MTKTPEEFQLRKLILQYPWAVRRHSWPFENLRWNELIQALLFKMNPPHRGKIRSIVRKLSRMKLLDVKELASIPANNGIDMKYPYAAQIAEILGDNEFTKEELENSILAIRELAKSLEKNYDGKIQKYLRKYGNEMVAEASQDFTFSKLGRQEVEFVFTLWLQNVFNIPLSLHDESAEKFCKNHDLKFKDLMDVADQIDYNHALVDDLIYTWNSPKKGDKKKKTD